MDYRGLRPGAEKCFLSDKNALLPAAAAASTSRCRLLLLLPAAHPDFILLDMGLQFPVFLLGLAAELVQDLGGWSFFRFCLERGRGGG